jgi:riboflavin synthase
MTTLTLIQRHIVPTLFDNRIFRISRAFRLINDRGYITAMIIGWNGAAIASYLIAVYCLFGLGAGMQQKSLLVKELIQSNTIIELTIQQKETAFARDNEDVLELMQKISDIRYVTPPDSSVSRVDVSSHAQ